MTVRVLAHEHGGDRIVAADAQSEDEASDHQEDEAGSQGRGDCAEDHDHGDA